MIKLQFILCVGISMILPMAGCAQQQQVDSDYLPAITKPLYDRDKGPLLLVDAGHHNFHTLDDKFAPFGHVAEMNGFVVKPLESGFTSEKLSGAKVLVIANALHKKNIKKWRRPVYQAFTESEIEVIRNWVWNGGSLFLIADHMPFAGAAADLAKSMGFVFYDGFAYCKPHQKFDVFSYDNGMLQHNELTNGLDSIVSFTGQAFGIPDSATSVITLDSTYKLLMPEVAWEFNKNMEMIDAGGMSQLAFSKYGSGKVVMAGEAAMFTAQRVGEVKFGLNAEFAPYNLALLINILDWLGRE